MKKPGRKALALLMAVLMMVSLLPMMAMAAEGEPATTPEATETSAPTEIPTVTETPTTTETPTVTETPATTDTPEVTETPTTTDTPEVTETPTTTDTPEVTETPAPTGTPAATGTPAPTETPAADEVPAAVKTFLDAVAAIVIPEEINEETGPVLNGQIGTAQAAYDALSEEDLAREDVQAAVAFMKKAMDALTGGTQTLTDVARIGEDTYASLDEAIAAAEDGATIELLADCETNGLNLSKDLTIEGSGKTITFKQYGIALWGKALTFNNCNIAMTGIGSTPYTAEWNWVAICASTNASLTLNNSTMTMDGTGAGNAHAIYFCSNNKLNLNASTLSISNYPQDALEWDGGDGGYNVNLTNSTFISDHNRSGFTGTFYATIDNSTVKVINSLGNGSNGTYYTIKNNSNVLFDGNTNWGISAWRIDMSNGSTLTATNNGYSGIWTRVLNVDGTCTLDVEGNGNNAPASTNNAGIFFQGNGSYTSTIEKGANVYIKNNAGSGIYTKQTVCNLTIHSAATIVNNGTGAVNIQGVGANSGGGIYNIGTMILDADVVIYNNHAGTAGDDIYNTGTISFGNTGATWALDGEPDCNGAIHAIDGWYEDGEGTRWLADTADDAKQHVVLKNAGTYTETVALKAAHGLIPVDPAPEIPGIDWKISKSKTATNLDENFESKVTLSLPSAEEKLVSDVVFVLDKSTSAALEQQALAMLQTLKTQIENTDAQVKVGVVIFNKVANMTNFMDLSTQYADIEAAITQEISSGTNTHAGLLAGIGMLDNDTAVDSSRKYLIFVSDGITYIYNQNPTVTAWTFKADSVLNWAGPDNWNSKYGSNNAPASWTEYLGRVKQQAEVQGTTYEYAYGGTPTNSTPLEGQSEYVNSIDKALYLTYEAYSAAASKYHCYAMTAATGSGGQYLWGPDFMGFLAKNESVDFSTIQNDILYLVDKGSYVKDYIGYVKDDYDFDFVNEADAMTLRVGDASYEARKIGENEYGFKPVGNGYAYTVTYHRGDGKGEEHFVWNINEPITNFKPVQLTYTVKLTNPKEATEDTVTYGQYDEDGSKGYPDLYTNNSATLYPVDSNGTEGDPQEFPKPTVSYTVEAAKQTVTVSKVWNDSNNADGLRPDSVTVALLANGKETGKTLVLNAANEWTGSFENLDAKDTAGNAITYTVAENSVEYYTTAITKADGTLNFTITNSHEVVRISIPVQKVWNDDNDANGKRPNSVTIYLYANGEKVDTMRLSAKSGWKGSFENLPVFKDGKSISYSISEKSMYFYDGKVTVNENRDGFVVTNTYTTSPHTGDTSNIGLWAALASISVIAMGAAVVIVRKKARKE